MLKNLSAKNYQENKEKLQNINIFLKEKKKEKKQQ